MGVRFDLGSSNVLAYLTSGGAHEPRLRLSELRAFLHYLAFDSDAARPKLISSSPEWVVMIRESAQAALNRLEELPGELEWNDYIDADTLRDLTAPVAQVLGSYDLYVLPVGTWRDADVLDRFAAEAARLPGHGILVLIPDFYKGNQNIRVMTPNEGTAQAVKNRETWPGAVFLLRTGNLPLCLSKAHIRYCSTSSMH